MRKLVVHAGFHKTATTTVQVALAQNADTLRPYVEYLPPQALAPARRSAKLYSVNHDPVELATFQALFCDAILALDPTDLRPALISSEDLSGYLIGRHGISTYAAAPALMAAIHAGVYEVFGDAVEVSFYFSARRKGWLKSCYWQLISNSTTHMSFEDFKRSYALAADFAPIVQNVSNAVAPAPVYMAEIEDLTTRLGPLRPLLELCDVPTTIHQAIDMPEPQNVAGSRKLRRKLMRASETAIQEGQTDQEIKRARRALIRKAKKR